MNRPWRTRIKICGMTRLPDALCAAEAGVDALGFIFFAKSPRCIEPQAARTIIDRLPPFVDAVGVFVNEDMRRVAEIATRCGLAYIQLHGSESPAYCRELSTLLSCCRLLKAFRVGEHSKAEDMAPYEGCVQGYLLDTYQKNTTGGTGLSFDWTVIDRLQPGKPFLLAGGLDITNIVPALAQVRPYGVDANSGLEDAPGKKNHQLIQQFIRSVRGAETYRLSGEQ
ncbi:phosphoribosylanthranilate isomerase [Desulfobulbus propionicus DSM 2032]|jgi:phosphoribosylanthranilate isomerase|uniref:N-(5'-phosphoribosyl)anthranilate isomerase n=1 Tax=Desulfobulbus propionicus (strain ATCC 33891 / DSM 2032 / VKM B-1956 / 1pr3) TaxID=577650 RepID=A0A7U4DNY3_DESPD|nr:phosphoribosylanthranilate isomerase [Desulfobulbus propionicus]ADW17566.1 phosphoribosylanthranilate isomerase [Desulfobulbus propionicus DSM 2032]